MTFPDLVGGGVGCEVGLLDLAISTLRIGLASFGPDRNLLLHNPRFVELLGLPGGLLRRGLGFAEMIRSLQSAAEFAGPDGEAFLAAQLALDRSRPSGVRHLRPTGQLIDLASDPLPGGGWTMMAMDIRPLARAEEQARDRATILDGVLASIPHGICVYGPDRRLTMYNRAYQEIMRDAPVAIGESVEQVIRRRAFAGEFGPGHPEEIIRRQLSFDVTRPQARRRQRPDGTTIDIRTAPLPDGGHISVVTDVTALIEAEDEISRHAAAMDAMLANIRHGIVLFDADDRVVACNPVASELLEQPPGWLGPGRLRAEVLEALGPRAEPGSRPLAERDPATPQHTRVLAPGGRVIEARSDPARAGGCVVTLTDVTEAQAAEAQLRRAKEAAEAANQAKSRFLATMSHELRTPLNAVIGFSDALIREAADPEPDHVEEFAQAVNEAGRHLLALINNILDVARIEAGRFDVAADQIDLPRLLRVCARQVHSAASAAEITVLVDVESGLPLLRGDERRLQQVVLHLLSNAVKFTEAGGTVTLSAAAKPNAGLVVRVADTGIGIPEGDLERVFEPFVQLDGSLARRFQGAGLGLYVSRALMQAQGGQISLASKSGIGTVAEIRLPPHHLVWPAVADGPQQEAQ